MSFFLIPIGLVLLLLTYEYFRIKKGPMTLGAVYVQLVLIAVIMSWPWFELFIQAAKSKENPSWGALVALLPHFLNGIIALIFQQRIIGQYLKRFPSISFRRFLFRTLGVVNSIVAFYFAIGLPGLINVIFGLGVDW